MDIKRIVDTVVKQRMLLNEQDVFEIKRYCEDKIHNGISQQESAIVYNILFIANCYYNNDLNGLLLIDDALYDGLVVLMNNYGYKTPIGAPRIDFINKPNKEVSEELETVDKREVVSIVPNKDSMVYFNNLVTNLTPRLQEDFIIHNEDSTLVNKKTRGSAHNYNMCGTLDKCKYVLDSDARLEGVYEDPSVSIFERDFLNKLISQGQLNPHDITLILSLKYDGISVENTVKGSTIINSCSRGDVSNNETSDLTPILGGMEFQRAKNAQIEDEFGIKFEYIITTQNLEAIKRDFSVDYVNRRNAVIGIFGRLDARRMRDYLTPIPLESSLNVDRISEITFLNKYYTKGVDMRNIVIRGDYLSVLKQVKDFVEEASTLRSFMPFAYDGIVVELADEELRRRLGKLNAIPRYAIAIKFPPLRRKSIFTHYTYSVGQTGVITPMAHFNPVEFFGAIHDKTTVHSLARFNKLNLAKGDRVNLSLNNDVIVYLTRDDYYSENDEMYNSNPPEQFPKECPCCGTPIVFSETGDSAYCPNFLCNERGINRMSNMLKKLNIKDFGYETIRALDIHNVVELFNQDPAKVVSILGKVNGPKFFERITALRSYGYNDYRLIGSIGFTGIAIATWKSILEHISIEKIIDGTDDEIKRLSCIKGIGNKTVNTIIEERKFFYNDLKLLFKLCMFKKTEINENGKPVPNIVFTGVRDSSVESMYEAKGFEVKPSVTQDTEVLVVPFIGFKSGKVDKAFKLLAKRYAIVTNNQPFAQEYSSLQLAASVGIKPIILDMTQAINYINNYNSNN